ncbi:MAG: phosphomannomutase/phosphoglucomutase [Clostridioides sp.]|jgi:phosphomannomutase|nr:phosphomannomutase/phosphoglucomutase [Clostridioides sp.]
MLKLQNGSDIRGIACQNDEKEVNLTPDRVKRIFLAFNEWLGSKSDKMEIKIAIGTDSRITGTEFREIGIDALTSEGVQVLDCEMATTPAMFMTTVMDGYNCDGAVMITASHLPYYHNGFKFFTKDGGLEKSDITEILTIASSIDLKEEHIEHNGEVEVRNLIEDYSKLLVDKIRSEVNSSENYDKPLLGTKILVDAGNGAGGFFEDKILAVLGADTTGSQFLNPDGMFPNHIPNPENKEAMKSACDAVVANESDIGIIFDTDVDRAALVGRGGKSINTNALIALISKIILNEHPNSTIVTDSITSDGLTKFIESNGGVHHRFKRGYKNVINEAIRLNAQGEKSYIAIETSGHAALEENYFLDDGSYLIAKILIEVARLKERNLTVMDLIADLEEPLESEEHRISIEVEDFKPYAQGIIEDLKEYVSKFEGWSQAPKNYEGVRVNCDEMSGNGWFLARISLHEPLLVLNIESNERGGASNIYSELKKFLSAYNLIQF